MSRLDELIFQVVPAHIFHDQIVLVVVDKAVIDFGERRDDRVSRSISASRRKSFTALSRSSGPSCASLISFDRTLLAAVEGIQHEVHRALSSLRQSLHDPVAIIEELAGWKESGLESTASVSQVPAAGRDKSVSWAAPPDDSWNKSVMRSSNSPRDSLALPVVSQGWLTHIHDRIRIRRASAAIVAQRSSSPSGTLAPTVCLLSHKPCHDRLLPHTMAT